MAAGQAVTLFDFAGNAIDFPVNSEGNSELPVNISGFVSVGNTTTDTLSADEVFTGEWEEIKDYGSIRVNLYSDKSAATSGVCFQQSPDQSIVFSEEYEYTAGDYELFTINPVAKYFRIVYTNSTADQTSFSLQTIYNYVYTKPTSHRLGDTVTGNDDTELVKSVVAYRSDPDDEYKNVSIQNPFPVDGDAVYEKDIWVAQSELNNFSGVVSDLFNNLHSIISDTTANDPKEILIHFNRTIISNVIGLGAFSGNFSNTLIQIGNSGGVFTTVIDESSDNTKHTSRTFQLPITAGFNAVKIQFHTTDTVTLSNCVIIKTKGVVSRLQASKPDNTVTDINATNGGNLKVSVEELESGISTNANSQLNTSPYFVDEFGNYSHSLGDNIFKGALIAIPPEHHEIHCGDSYTGLYTGDLSNGADITFAVVIPDEGLSEAEEGDSQNTKQYHVVFYLDTEAEALITAFEGAELSNNGTAISVLNRNRNSTRTDYIGLYHTPTITSPGTQVYAKRIGSGKNIGGQAGRGSEFIFKDNTTYLITILNATTSNNYYNFELNYYVHPGV